MWTDGSQGSLRKKIIPICMILMVLLLTNLVAHEKLLIIEDLDNQKKNEVFLPEKTFTLGYIHSVLLTPAEEYFRVEKGNELMLYKTIYESFGVGLPYSQEEWDFEIKGDKFILNIKRPFPSIKMRISPIPKHWLGVGETRYELMDFVEKPDDLVEIYAVDRWGLKIGKRFYDLF